MFAVQDVAREHRGHSGAMCTAPARAPSAASLEDEFEFSSDDGGSSSGDEDDEDDEGAATVPAKRARTELDVPQDKPQDTPQDAPPQPETREGNTLTVQVRAAGQKPLVMKCTDTERVGALTARLQRQISHMGDAKVVLCTAYPRRTLDPESTLRECGVRDRSVLVLETK